MIFQAFLDQPPALSAVAALRAAMRQVFGSPNPELDRQYERGTLLMAVPELRMRMLDEGVRSIRDFATVIAQRSGRDADDPAVVTLAGAVMGVCITIWLSYGGVTVDGTMLDALDQALARLETGISL